MKLLRFGPAGQEKPGLLDQQNQIRDLSGVLPDISGSTIGKGLLGRLSGLDPKSLPLVPAGVRIGPCVGQVGNFVAVGLNYSEHATETGAEIPSEPILFNKAPSCIVGPMTTSSCRPAR
jgi:2,4-didehydro-3-deoxy-L-rhamnonate hydrolase